MIPQKDLSVLQFLNFVGQMTRDNGLKKDEEIAHLKTEHEEEIEKLKVELVAAKSKETAAPTAIGSEFYRKKISALQSHYEKQIQDLEASRKSSGSTNSDRETEGSDSTQSGNSEYMTGEEVLESNRGTLDGSLEGENKCVSGLVEKGMHNLLYKTEVEFSDDSIIVIEDEDRYVQYGRNNS